MRLLSGWAFVPVMVLAACGGSSYGDSNAPPGPGNDGGGDAAQPPVDGGGPTCEAPKTSCGGKCVDTKVDDKNCGGCGVACKAGEACASSACILSLGFAVRKIFLGDSNRDGAASKDAWKQYGENIDGLASVATPTGECLSVAGASSQNRVDGDNGIDNAWGKIIIPFLAPFTATPSKTTSDGIEAGGRTPVVVFGAHTGNVSPFPAGFAILEKTALPSWDGKDARQLTEDSTTSGNPKATFLTAKVTNGSFVSGDLSGTFIFELSLQGAPLRVPINRAHVTMKIAPDGTKATEGVISGVIPTEELVAAIALSAGFISKQLCEGSTLDSIKQSIRQASDIMKDGTQDPTKECDGISVGLGFDAVAVSASGVGPKEQPLPDPCK